MSHTEQKASSPPAEQQPTLAQRFSCASCCSTHFTLITPTPCILVVKSPFYRWATQLQKGPATCHIASKWRSWETKQASKCAPPKPHPIILHCLCHDSQSLYHLTYEQEGTQLTVPSSIKHIFPGASGILSTPGLVFPHELLFCLLCWFFIFTALKISILTFPSIV